jgi:hypothetical protein
MILGTVDWIIFITLFIVILIVSYGTIKGMLSFQKTFFLAIVFIFLFILWGIIRTEYTMLPEWILAGATSLLLIVTAMSTYANIEMVKSNQNLVQITKDQMLMQVKEMRRKLIIEFSRKVIQDILMVLQRERQFLDSGYYITYYGFLQKEGKGKDIHYKTPKDIYKNHIPISDSILQKYLDQIYQLNGTFDDYSNNLNSLLKRIFKKEQSFIDAFNGFCASLPNPDKTTIVEHNDDAIFVMALADSKSENYPKYIFFNHHREVLISKLFDASFKQDMEDYKKMKDTYSEIKKRYETIFNSLFKEWKEEYYVTDAELGSDLSYMM